MKTYFLALDFGASHTKAALIASDNFAISQIQHYPSLGNISHLQDHWEVSGKALQQQFLAICHDYKKSFLLKGIVLCSQMHGFVLVDENNQALTEYISWQDERSLEKINGLSTYDLICEHWQANFLAITGMKLRPGLPYVNALHILRQKPQLTPQYKLLSLPEWLALACEATIPLAHNTLLAGSGCFDIQTNKISTPLVDFFYQQTNVRLQLNEATAETAIVGYVKKIPVYNGVGDLQCALLGAGIMDSELSINIGTGSQVSSLCQAIKPCQFEYRPYFKNTFLLTQTHIPAGRALNEYFYLLTQVCQDLMLKEVDIWDYVKKNMTAAAILHSTLEMDLAIFKSAYGYKNGGAIKQIYEGQWNIKNYCASLLRSLLKQYVEVAQEMLDLSQVSACRLSGGIPKKLPMLAEALTQMLGKPVIMTPDIADETLLGLQSLVKRFIFNV